MEGRDQMVDQAAVVNRLHAGFIRRLGLRLHRFLHPFFISVPNIVRSPPQLQVSGEILNQKVVLIDLSGDPNG